VVNERCLDPGVQDDGCPAGTLGVGNGVCQPAGVPPEGCAPGFESDGEGPCEPILPAEPCGYGFMAIPGETACRPVMDCGDGRWGSLPVDAATVYVDVAYTGGGSDGSESKPWTRINDALMAAPAGSLIAVAAGSYAEDLNIIEKPVRLWGVCPDRVALAGTGPQDSAIVVGLDAASGTEVGGMAITGIRGAVFVSGVVVTFDRVWVRDSPLYAGVEISRNSGPTTVTLRDSLVENNHLLGIYAGGVELTVERSIVRGSLPSPSDMTMGRGLQIQPPCSAGVCDVDTLSNAVIRASVIEKNHEAGVSVAASQVSIDGTVIRDTYPDAVKQIDGSALLVRECDLAAGCARVVRGSAVMRGSNVSNVADAAVRAWRSDMTIEGSVIRDVAPTAMGLDRGRGVVFEGCGPLQGCAPPKLAKGVVRGTLVERTHDIGIFVMGSEVTIEGSSVRHTEPRAYDGEFGRGISAQIACDDTCDPMAPANLIVRGTRVEDVHQFGIAIVGSDGTIEASLVRTIVPQAADGGFGDGLVVTRHADRAAAASLRTSRIEDSARAGVAAFASTGFLADNAVVCAGIPLVSEELELGPATLDDGGGNRCGCPTPTSPCQAISANLAPPPPLD